MKKSLRKKLISAILKDESISFNAKGIYIHIIKHPDKSDEFLNGIWIFKDYPKKGLRIGLKELEVRGYIWFASPVIGIKKIGEVQA